MALLGAGELPLPKSQQEARWEESHEAAVSRHISPPGPPSAGPVRPAHARGSQDSLSGPTLAQFSPEGLACHLRKAVKEKLQARKKRENNSNNKKM